MNEGKFSLYLQRTNNPANPAPVAFDQVVSGTIPDGIKMNAYTFNASAGDWVLFRLLDSGGMAFQPDFRVYRPDGTSLCSAAWDPYAEVHCTLDIAGTYTMLVGDYGGDVSGSYKLYLQRTNNPANPSPIAFDQVVSGAIADGMKMNAYTFSASSGDYVLFRLVDTSGTVYQPDFHIFRPDGTQVCYGYSDTFTEELCGLNATGTYTILVGDREGDYPGSYSLYIQRTNNPANPIAISYGSTISASITTAPAMKAFTFTGAAGQTVRVRVTESSNLNPIVRIYRPDGTQLCQASGSNIVELQCTLNTNGIFTILVGDQAGDQVGDFNLTLEQVTF